MKTETFKANNARQIVAHQQIAEYGTSYFNPLIGSSAGITCSRVEPVMELLYGLFGRDLISEDMSPGIKLIVQTVWSAVQYEREVFSKEEKESA
jgi:hypothetical protein